MLNQYINRHLRAYERHLPLRERLKRWHRYRVIHDAGPIFWTLSWVWCYRPFYWLWRLRCRNVEWRINRHNQRLTAKTPTSYTWSRT